ncbi:spore maturation protein [Paenalkalicoccus suaedae]|uniref:Spore maturation protein n=1 Tax=Paenalkalicoccus suaedae TaxID=2592382 RepID=A0A859FD93_9BACI|nr:spore maturation protein [Paenalkalicoccus suaedae]QKS71047.1 spore maturation protein [Paenalkalicoccus suaedae]
MSAAWLIPLIVSGILLLALKKRLPAYELFVEGAKEGVDLSFRLIPFIVGMSVAIAVLRESGALFAFGSMLSPILSFIGVPEEVVPLALMRPISGSGALAITADLNKTYGPDSFIATVASVMQGSTDTTLYVLTVYFGAVGIKKMGHALKVGLLADLSGMIAAIIIVSYLFT